MDVRLLALPDSPSAAVALSGEHFCGLPKRGPAQLLANVMSGQAFWNQTDGLLLITSGFTPEHAGNGVPIVNIAAPNTSCLSQNRLHEYSVGTEGLLAKKPTQSTQRDGSILGNPSLRGTAAITILNEVDGGSASQFRGYVEAAGRSIHVTVSSFSVFNEMRGHAGDSI
ncbi:two-partner secretion domain-containing protein [Pseudomonas sp. OV226]|uniref:two-partner secretion domain-containing protein n=1 Tax=Pseudomonas sp. OV226 TaxID=2135588 RepID=UPI000D6B2778|nr:ShlA/HecA/FhaA protein [Pseudomonas sp. OV226]PWK28766.1 filamentous hemagglutinin family protein [Pseudomonas sp. OV226]